MERGGPSVDGLTREREGEKRRKSTEDFGLSSITNSSVI